MEQLHNETETNPFEDYELLENDMCPKCGSFVEYQFCTMQDGRNTCMAKCRECGAYEMLAIRKLAEPK